jgi:hypothetical protein
VLLDNDGRGSPDVYFFHWSCPPGTVPADL